MGNELKPYGCSTRMHREISSKEELIRLGSEEHELYLTKISLAIKKDTCGIDRQLAHDSTAIFPLSSMIAFGAEPQSSVSKSYCQLRAKGVTAQKGSGGSNSSPPARQFVRRGGQAQGVRANFILMLRDGTASADVLNDGATSHEL